MIGYFPTIYPDELVYSVLSRYHVKSGNINISSSAKDLLASTSQKNYRQRLSVDFINKLTPVALHTITQNITMKDLICNHTMFPYYARFLNKQKREIALESLINMECNQRKVLFISQDRAIDNLRYCPLCVIDDKNKYGETYWHRCHQIKDINICYIHYCELLESKIIANNRTTHSFITAEEAIDDCPKIIISENKLERQIANYVIDVFLSDVNMETDTNIEKFLHSKISYTKYVSVRGQQRNLNLIYNDFIEYYKDFPCKQFNQQWQIQKVFSGQRINTYEICLLSIFFGISVESLINMYVSNEMQQNEFDKKIFELHEQGMSYVQIANQLNTSYTSVKKIGNKKYTKESQIKENVKKKGKKTYDWSKTDDNLFPIIKELTYNLRYDISKQPKKITIHTIEQTLSLPYYGLKKCPKCRQEIEKYHETYEEYWARKTVWAINKIKINGEKLTYAKVRNLVNIRKENFLSCIPYLIKYSDENSNDNINEFIELINNLE